MKVFLAGVETVGKSNQELLFDKYNLISFYSVSPSCTNIITNSKMFLLDSGAFSFMRSCKKHVNWDDYINQYTEFINKYNIQYFFELDIDNVVGYEKVLLLRKRLEEKTQKKCIPVWHKGRGIEEFKKMCDEYSYVAIGGIVTNEISRDDYKVFPMLIQEAHKRGAKIHGLGFTSTKLLKTIHFDSVDSTNWSYGRYGHYWEFTKQNTMVMHTRPHDKRCSNAHGLQAYNLTEWIKFQKYAEANL